MLPLKILLTLFFESSSLSGILQQTLFFLGLWFVFRKCGEPAWHVLIPGYRDYALSRCADREPEGRVLFISKLFLIAGNIYTLFQPEDSVNRLFFDIVLLSASILVMVYSIRVYVGLIEVFGRRKRWILLWLFLEFLAAPLWGFSPKFQPKWRIQDFENEFAEYFSGSRAAILENGLTVNLEERTATEFFKKKYLLRDIHLNVQPGHMVLLLGGSGSGKTTLLNAINGYEKAKAEVILNGSNVYNEYKHLQYDVGFVPQQDLMRGSDTVLHTLTDAAKLRLPETFTGAERKKRVFDVMEMFGLTTAQNTMLDKMSGGQRKRLSIAMEFLSNPSLFILDEPDSGLDGVMARELMQQLRAIADQGKIVIVITHTPDRVIDLFDDVIVLARDSRRTGRLAFFGTTDEARRFFERERMEQIVMCINRKDEGGEGRADEFIRKFAEVQHG